jgi:hypothetical protein
MEMLWPPRCVEALSQRHGDIASWLQRHCPLRRVHNHFRGRFARFKLGAHLLDLRGLLFELRPEKLDSFLLLGNRGLQFLHSPVLFDELVEQHVGDRVIAHSQGFSIFVASYQIRTHIFHVLGDETELPLPGTIRIKLVLHAVGHRFQREERFAGLVHWLNVLLVTSRGDLEAKSTARRYSNRDSVILREGVHVADIGRVVHVGTGKESADTNNTAGVSDGASSQFAHSYIVATSDILASCITQGGVRVSVYKVQERVYTNPHVKGAGSDVPECVIPEGVVRVAIGVHVRLITHSRAEAIVYVVSERLITDGHVVGTGSVSQESLRTEGGISAGGVASERVPTDSRDIVAGGVDEGRLEPNGCVAVTVPVETLRPITNSDILAADRVEQERIDAKSTIKDAGGVIAEGIKTHSGVAVAPRNAVSKRKTADSRVPNPGYCRSEGVLSLSRVVARVAAIRRRIDRLG